MKCSPSVAWQQTAHPAHTHLKHTGEDSLLTLWPVRYRPAPGLLLKLNRVCFCPLPCKTCSLESGCVSVYVCVCVCLWGVVRCCDLCSFILCHSCSLPLPWDLLTLGSVGYVLSHRSGPSVNSQKPVSARERKMKCLILKKLVLSRSIRSKKELWDQMSLLW